MTWDTSHMVSHTPRSGWEQQPRHKRVPAFLADIIGFWWVKQPDGSYKWEHLPYG